MQQQTESFSEKVEDPPIQLVQKGIAKIFTIPVEAKFSKSGRLKLIMAHEIETFDLNSPRKIRGVLVIVTPEANPKRTV